MIKFIFEKDDWPNILPQELLIFSEELSRPYESRWKELPFAYWPQILKEAGESFWVAFKDGKDTRDISSFLDGVQSAKLVKYLGRDPTGLYAVLSVPLDVTEEVGRFYYKLLEEMSSLLKESNIQDGKFHPGVVAAKAKAFGNFRGSIEGLARLKDMGVMGNRIPIGNKYKGGLIPPKASVPMVINNGDELSSVLPEEIMDVPIITEGTAKGKNKNEIPDQLSKNNRDLLDKEYEDVLKKFSAKQKTW